MAHEHDCDATRREIPWLLDDDVDAVASLEVEEHVASCEPCKQFVEGEVRIRQVTRDACRAVKAPERLTKNIRSVLEKDRRRRRLGMHVWPAAAAAMILMAFVWKGVTQGVASDELSEIASRHAMNLPMDVEINESGRDVRGLQDYLSGRLRFSVRIPKIEDERMLLRGARITRVREHDAAQVVFRSARGPISLFVYRSDHEPVHESSYERSQVRLQKVRGYTAVRWKDQGMVYSVVGELPEADVSDLFLRSRP